MVCRVALRVSPWPHLWVSGGPIGCSVRAGLVSSGPTVDLGVEGSACQREGALVAPQSKVELFAAIRRDSRVDGLGVRALARKYEVHRRLVREALASVWPAPRKKLPPRKSRLDPFKPAVDQMLRADLDAPRKQRHTLKRIFDRLVAEHEMEGVSYSTVGDYVRWRRPEIRVEEGRGPAQVFIGQAHQPGAEAEVDLGDVWILLAGVLTKCYLFTFRLSYSGKSVHRVSMSCGQEAFFEGHVHAFSVLGGVPCAKVRYDNLRSAVARVLGFGRARVETDRWAAFRSHSLLTELTGEFPQFTGQMAGGVATVPAHVRRRGRAAGSRGAGCPAGRDPGRDW
jgi:transposase